MWAETDLLAADLDAAAARLGAAVTPVMAKGGVNVKKDWRQNASGLAHAPAYPASIGYDITVGPERVVVEIGPDKNKAQGALGNLLEFGSANNPPHNDGGRALDAEEPRLLAALQDAATKAVLG